MSYEFLQSYWWFVVSLMAAFLVFFLFVQGANSMIFELGKNPEERRLVINSTGRKWEFTFTTLVTFGASFFASFPLFYSTSFGGAYWVWMLILFSFVLQAVSYEFQNKLGNFLGAKTFQICLIINGIVGPLLIGGAVATFFNGSNFVIEKSNMFSSVQPVISHWANASGGLDVLLDLWAVLFGVAVFFLARILGILYINNNINDAAIRERIPRTLLYNTVIFLVTFLTFFIRTLLKDGYASDPAMGAIFMEPYKYFNNLVQMWPLAVILLVGVVLLLFGIGKTIFVKNYTKGIWPAAIGVMMVVLVLFLIVGWNDTAFYPSNVDIQYSLTIRNSCSSETTLRAMAYVSLLIPVIVAYGAYAWWSIDKKKIDRNEIKNSEAY
ncbi:cytochrome C oxidase assembly protein [Prevotella sp. S7-1-8]|uniref:cytochrome d ubiquinol oxidase subunit II n=1 Tax=Prevotella sp. S7-1-8 TaxID=1284775 RepID=UPI00051012B6|nr:cytochrome d ubiquinol oxidase subunit II [Prevotella sp. S7-1-8]KGF16245.1 cytochrome C oxidase assembly protein [Prevotella sp. S7-1-8]